MNYFGEKSARNRAQTTSLQTGVEVRHPRATMVSLPVPISVMSVSMVTVPVRSGAHAPALDIGAPHTAAAMPIPISHCPSRTLACAACFNSARALSCSARAVASDISGYLPVAWTFSLQAIRMAAAHCAIRNTA
ncbi:hypothetical protein [Xanthomonas sp. BRIP62411]|uniref:hypothetical protein n=1 Tax=Xanthomonas sp. BRIP62411 TaxID=2182389 RepID=UPI0031B6A499